MSVIHRLMGIGICTCLLLAATAQASVIDLNTTLIGVDYETGSLYEINTADASMTLLGNLDFTSVGGLEAYGETLYAVQTGYGSAAKLRTIDLGTMTSTIVGQLGGSYQYGEGSLAIAADGTAYSARGFTSNMDLVTIDLGTGAASFVADLDSGSHDINGMVVRSDGQLVAIDLEMDAIVLINPATGVVVNTPLVNLGQEDIDPGSIGGMTIGANGLGYFVTANTHASIGGDNTLYSVDLFTGDVTIIDGLNIGGNAYAGKGIGGLAVITPEPAALALLVAGFAGLIARRRKLA